MRLRHVYLLLCVAGLVLPYSQFVPWVREHGLDLPLLVRELFANRISAFFGLDVLVSAVAAWIFVGVEGRRLGLRARWLPLLAILTVGVSLGLPLFLYLRQARIDTTA